MYKRSVFFIRIIFIVPLVFFFNLALAACLDINILEHSCRYPSGDKWCQEIYLGERTFAYLSSCDSLPGTEISSEKIKSCIFINISSGSLNIREKPSLSSRVISQARKGSVLGVYDSYYNQNWRKVKLNNGKVGYASSDYLFLNEESEWIQERENACGLVNVNSGQLNIRQKPNLNSRIIGQAYKKSGLRILERYSDWYKVKLNDGKIGYASRDYIDVKEEQQFAEDRTQISHSTRQKRFVICLTSVTAEGVIDKYIKNPVIASAISEIASSLIQGKNEISPEEIGIDSVVKTFSNELEKKGHNKWAFLVNLASLGRAFGSCMYNK
jgi:SH3-like domain-containing protein